MKIAMVAAGFSAGEADSLRRAMAAWRKKGGMNVFEQRLTAGLTANGYSPTFAQAIVKQIEGFGEYGFPESHAASFAWLAYVSAWLKCHEPEAFLAALLNAQPMGFYSPSQLIQDSRRHGVTVLPVDVQFSLWDCGLEYSEALSTPQQQRPAVRLGFNQVKGLSIAVAQRMTQARRTGPFDSIKDLARRAQLSAAVLEQLAGAASLGSLSKHRRDAIWQSATAVVPNDLLREAVHEEALPDVIDPPSDLDNTSTDYAYLGYTLGEHPLALLRPTLEALRYTRFDGLSDKRQGQIVRACGLITLRQRPHTAKGVMFITLEDETGNLNVIVYPGLIERWRQALLRGVLLGVVGTWQCQRGVQHLLAGRLIDETRRLDEAFR